MVNIFLFLLKQNKNKNSLVPQAFSTRSVSYSFVFLDSYCSCLKAAFNLTVIFVCIIGFSVSAQCVFQTKSGTFRAVWPQIQCAFQLYVVCGQPGSWFYRLLIPAFSCHFCRGAEICYCPLVPLFHPLLLCWFIRKKCSPTWQILQSLVPGWLNTVIVLHRPVYLG